MPIIQIEKALYPKTWLLLASAELQSVLGMHRSELTTQPMNLNKALTHRELDAIEAKLSKLSDDDIDKLSYAMTHEDPEIEDLLNNWAEYAGLI